MQAFIICGYGIPKDMAHDENYITYLRVAFNNMYEQAASQPAVIIPEWYGVVGGQVYI